MARVRGREAVRRFYAETPAQLDRVLRGAARAGADVVADQAKQNLGARRVDLSAGGSVLLADAVKVATKAEGNSVTGLIQMKGPGAFVAPWLENGTSPHFISVDPDFSEGRTAGRINRLDRTAAKEGRSGPGASLVINGKPVGATVHHPGARAHPFLLPALDHREADAVAAAQTYINARVRPSGIVATDEEDEA